MSLQAIFIFFNVIALVALSIAALLVLRRSRTPKAAYNLTDYYDDETLEGPRLERVLGWALIFSVVIAAALPAYWLVAAGAVCPSFWVLPLPGIWEFSPGSYPSA